MKNNFFNLPVANIYSKPSSNSKVSSQILYGEKFEILKRSKNWVKIKTNFDNYVGFIKIEKFKIKFEPVGKIFKVKSTIYKKKRNNFYPTKNFIYFASGIEINTQNKNFVEFEKNKWIKITDVKKIQHNEKNFIKVFQSFIDCKYLWGGKTFEGIDCSALIQIYFYYNRIFFPRDSKDQINFCKKTKKKSFYKGDIIFWKGHVGICLNKSKFIHAYGPRKKVLIMPTKATIKLIKKTANLKVKKVSNIKKY